MAVTQLPPACIDHGRFVHHADIGFELDTWVHRSTLAGAYRIIRDGWIHGSDTFIKARSWLIDHFALGCPGYHDRRHLAWPYHLAISRCSIRARNVGFWGDTAPFC